MYLAAAGIGKLGILDFDTLIFRISNAKSSTARKTWAAPKPIRQGNHRRDQSNVEVVCMKPHQQRKRSGTDQTVRHRRDGTDNFPTVT